MKTHLLKKVSAFIITAIISSASTNAQIVYTDVNPDVTINTNGGVYALDLNNDGTNDYVITKSFSTFGTCGTSIVTKTSISVSPLGTNQILDNTGTYATNMAPNAIINAASLIWSDSANQFMASFISGCRPKYYGQWVNAVNGYLGLKLISGGNTYYGWARLNTIGASSFTIKDYAYNSIPNQPILAGQTSCTTPTVSLTQSGPLSFCNGDSVTLTVNGTGYQYQWRKNNANIVGATSKTYVAKTPGTYKCKVTNSCGSKFSGGKTVTIPCRITNENMVETLEQLSVYPNPATSTVTIKFPSDSYENDKQGEIQIVNLFGQIVYSEKVNQQQTQIEVSSFAAGMYMIRWSTGENFETKTFSVTK